MGGGAAPHAPVEAEIFIWRRVGGRRGWRRCDAAVLLLGEQREEAVCVLRGSAGGVDTDPAAVCRCVSV